MRSSACSRAAWPWLVAALLTLCACEERVTRAPMEPIEPALNNEKEPPPPVKETIDDYALKAPVEILRDEHGVPHVYAQDDLDLFYGAGYQIARERLFDLDVNRRAALGTRAEVFGPSKVSADLQARTLRWAVDGRASIQALAQARPKDHNLLVAYTAGINAYLDQIKAGQAPLPEPFMRHGYQPEPFEPWHIMASGLRINFGYSSQLEFDLLNTLLHRLRPAQASLLAVHQPAADAFTMLWDQPQARRLDDQPPQASPQAPPQAPPELSAEAAAEIQSLIKALAQYRHDLRLGEGSNAWAIRGEHTFNGRPLLANDSHASLHDPNALYLMHLNSMDASGSFDVMGFGFVGIPGVQLGHNRSLAWGATTHFADMMDLFEVSTRPDSTSVRLGQRDYPLARRQEVIKVKGAQDVTLTVTDVPGVGVILPEAFLPVPKITLTRQEILLAYPGFTGTTELSMFLDLDRAKTLADFEAAIDQQRVGMQNWHGATVEGIRYRTSGLVPDRGKLPEGVTPDRLMSASTPGAPWMARFIAPARLPRLDGQQPFHMTANNDPWGHTADNNPLNDDFYYGSFYAPGYRAGRLLEALREQVAAGGVTVEQTQQLQLERRSQVAPALIPKLQDASQQILMLPELEPFTELVEDDQGAMLRRCKPSLCEAVDALVAWDGQMSTDSSSALLFRLWLAFLSRRTLEDDLSALLFDAIDSAQPVTTVKMVMRAYVDQVQDLLGPTPQVTLLASLQDALEVMAQRELKVWGDLHVSRFITADDLVLISEPTGGDDTSLNVAQVRCWDDERQIAPRCTSTAGAVFRSVTSFDEDGTPRTVFNFAQGNGVPLSDWLQGAYTPWIFKTDAVRASAGQDILRLEP